MTFSKFLIIAGSLAVLLGLILNYVPWLISWFGHLPGDIRIEDENKFIFIPITSMILVSVLISLVMYLFSLMK